MNQNALYKKRLNRVLRAVALEEPDRVPVVLQYAAFAARVTKRPMAEFVRSPKKAMETMIQAYRLIGGGDAMNYGSFYPYWLCYSFGAEVKIPGIDLRENEIWQVLETEVMGVEDYDRILKLGWKRYFQDFLEKRVLNRVPLDRLPLNQERVAARKHWAQMGLPVLSNGTVATPIELLSGSRSLPKFAMDLFRIPEKVEAVMDAIAPHLAAGPCRRAQRNGYAAVWIGGWRSAPSMLSPAMWNRFAWPYLRRVVNEVVDAGLIALLHLDSKWDRELARFRELPRGKCIMATDGETDLFKAKEVLGDHICLMGDVPATMLCLGSPDQVYEYGTRLIRNLGPEGFILHSGCDIPANAKLENVQAMVAAATGT